MEKTTKRKKVQHAKSDAPAQNLKEVIASINAPPVENGGAGAEEEVDAPVEQREIRIKFRNAEGEEIGDEIMIDSRTSKIDLNKILD
jgi:hypothetical protein